MRSHLLVGGRGFFSSPPHVLQLILLLLDLAGIVVSAVSADTLTFFNPIIRPLVFISMSRRARRAVVTFARVLPDLFNWAAMLVLLLVFYALLGVMLFGPPDPLLGTDAERAADVGSDGDYFSSLPKAMLSLVVLITTANFPDVMLPAYQTSRATFLFFASFLLVRKMGFERSRRPLGHGLCSSPLATPWPLLRASHPASVRSASSS